MDITKFDVKTIFPNSDLLEEIFMDQLGGLEDMFNSFKAWQLKKTIYGLCDKHLGYGITNLIVFSLNMIFIQVQLTFVSTTMPRTIISSSFLLRLVIFIVAKLKTLFNTWVKLFKSQQVLLTHMWAYTLWNIKSTKWFFGLGPLHPKDSTWLLT